MVTRQDIHAVLYAALESGDWTAEELHDEVDEVADAYAKDQAAEGGDA